MKKTIASLAFGLLAAANSHADVVKGEFTTLYGTAGTVASYGDITLSLNADGTIAANVHLTGPDQIVGVSIDSNGHVLEQGLPAGAWETTWWSDLGSFATGIVCNESPCGYDASWTIGYPGWFTSVSQLLTGTGSDYDFFLYTSGWQQFAANAAPAGDVPEPAALALVGLGLAGLAAARGKAGPAR